MLDTVHHVFIVGIKGVSMSNLAVILKQMGKDVTGTDVDDEFITDATLRAHGITTKIGFDPDLLTDDIDLVIYSAAHQGKRNLITQKALENHILVMHEAQLRGELTDKFPISIAVSGSHGKTTTSGLLAYALTQLEQNPSYIVGSSGFNNLFGGNYHQSDYFVVEADEYGIDPPADKTPKLHFFHPKFILTTNIDLDHPDMYADIEEVKQAFSRWYSESISRHPDSQFVVCADDTHLIDVIAAFTKEHYITYGFNENADYQIKNVRYFPDKTEFELSKKNGTLIGQFNIQLFGEKNVSNVTGAITLLLHLGFPAAEIQKAIKDYTGAKRRFELVYQQNSYWLFDDYAHHPAEIKAVITATRQRYPDNKIILIFQPHTFSRTEKLKSDFIQALQQADQALIAPIYASAREDSTLFTISSESLVKEAQQNGVTNLQSFATVSELKQQLTAVLSHNCVIFTMGAGDIYKMKNDIIEVIKNRA